VHSSKSRFRSPEQKQERSKQLAQEKTEKTYRNMLARAVLNNFPKVAQHDDLFFLAQCTFSNIGHDNRRRVFGIYEWEQKKTPGQHGVGYVDFDALLVPRLKAMSSAQLYHFCFICHLAGDLFVPQDSTECLAASSRLMQVAKRQAIDTKNIHAKAAAQVADARKKNN
jgi:hypothetical protein